MALTLAAIAVASAQARNIPPSATHVTAHAAHVLSINDEGHLRFIHSSGSRLLDEGSVSGSFPGKVRVQFNYNGEPTVSAQFTIFGHGGSITAHGTGTLSSPVNPTPSFHGGLTVTSGTGRYAHIHGSGQLYGVFYRRGYALTVQAIAKLSY